MPGTVAVDALVLAAGRSTRMGARNKLLLELDGLPLIRHAVASACASRARSVIVVTGHDAAAVRAALQGLRVGFAHNEDLARGLSASLRIGLDALPHDAAAALVCLGDMPRVASNDLDRLIDAFVGHGADRVCVPEFRGQRGNPVLWPARCFSAMRALQGDVGARALLAAEGERVVRVGCDHTGILFDVDQPSDLER